MPGGHGKKKKGQAGGFKTQLLISPELREFLGRERVSRPMLTKLMWAYFKSNKRLDPADKRWVVCDEKLKTLTGLDRFQAFSFMKLLNKHIVKLDKPEQVYGCVEGEEEEEDAKGDLKAGEGGEEGGQDDEDMEQAGEGAGSKEAPAAEEEGVGAAPAGVPAEVAPAADVPAPAEPAPVPAEPAPAPAEPAPVPAEPAPAPAEPAPAAEVEAVAETVVEPPATA